MAKNSIYYLLHSVLPVYLNPFYLAQKAQEVGYHPEIILAGRRLNDSMGAYVAQEVVKIMVKAGKPVKDAKALMLGITFKENCPDIRNTRATDIYHELKDFTMDVDVYDPWADKEHVKQEYGIDLVDSVDNLEQYSAIILAVAHDQFKELNFSKIKSHGIVLYDVKSILPKEFVDGRL